MLRFYLPHGNKNENSQDVYYFIVLRKEGIKTVVYVSEEEIPKTYMDRKILEFSTFYIDDEQGQQKVNIDFLLRQQKNEIRFYKKSNSSEDDSLLEVFNINEELYGNTMIDYLVETSNTKYTYFAAIFNDIDFNSLQTYDPALSVKSHLRSKTITKATSNKSVKSYTFNQLLKIDKLTNFYLKNIIAEINDLKTTINTKLQFKKNENNLKLNYYEGDNRDILKKIDTHQGHVLDLKDELNKIKNSKTKIEKKTLDLEIYDENILESPVHNPLYKNFQESVMAYTHKVKKTNELLLRILQIDLSEINLETIEITSFHEVQNFNYKLGNLLLYLQIIHRILQLPFFFNNHKMVIKYKSSQSFIVIVTSHETEMGVNKLIIPLYILSVKSLDKSSDYFQRFKLGVDWLNSKITMVKEYTEFFD